MENILNRIEKIVSNEGITITALERNIGASKGVLSRAIANNTDIQHKWVQIIVENYPHYSTEWLITGNGEMLKLSSFKKKWNKDEEVIKGADGLSLSERLSLLIEKKQVNIYEVSKQAGVPENKLNRILNGDTRLTIGYASKLADYFNVDFDWFWGGMDKKETDAQFYDPENKPIERKLIPFYDTTAVAGTLQISNMDPVAEPAEYIDAGDWFLDADSAMRVHGDSMFPEYKSGNIVVMREVFDKRLIVYGEDYMIQTNEYKVIKRLMQSSEKGSWLACSVNDEIWETGPLKGRLIHEPFLIFIDDVTKICRVIGCVKRTESSRIVYNKNKKI